MDNPILQASLLLFLLFATHVYFLINKILTKEQKENINYFQSGLILFTVTIVIIIIGIVYNDFITNYSLSEENKIISFIAVFKDLIMIFIAAITAFFIYRQIKAAQQTTQEQIKAAQDSLNKQIEYQNKMKNVEIIINSINKLIQKLEILIEKPVPMPDSYINYLLNSTYTNHYYKQDFSLKIVTFTDNENGKEIILPWDILSNYFHVLKNNNAPELTDFIKNDSKYEYRVICTQLTNILYFCEKLFKLDNNNLIFIHSVLIKFYNIVNQLKYYDFVNTDFIINYNTYLSLYKHDVIPEDDMKEFFLTEINSSNLLNYKIEEHNIEEVKRGLFENIKDPEFAIKIDGEIYERNKGEWKKLNP